MLEDALSLAEKVGGPEDQVTLGAMSKLADAYAGLGRNEEALALHEQVLSRRQKTLSPHHRLTLACMINVGQLATTLGKYAEAEPLLTTAYEGFVKRRQTSATPFDEEQCRKAAGQLVQLYERSGRLEEASVWQAKLDGLPPEPTTTEVGKKSGRGRSRPSSFRTRPIVFIAGETPGGHRRVS